MHRFDPELIAALAEGSLDEKEARRLEDEIAGDTAAAAELAMQRAAIDALAGAPRPAMSDSERTRLRSSVAASLGLSVSADRAPAPRRVAWSAIAVAGAALVAIIAIVPVVGLLSTDDGDAGSATSPLEIGADSFDDAASQQRTAADLEVADPLDGEEPAPAFGGGSAEAPATTTVAAVTTAPISDTTTVATAEDSGGVADDLERLREDAVALAALAGPVGESTPCGDEAIMALDRQRDDILVFEYADGESEYLVFYEQPTGEDATGRLVALHAADCSPAAEVP
jgi:hypothetical protein